MRPKKFRETASMLRLPWFFDRFRDRHLFFKSDADLNVLRFQEHKPVLADEFPVSQHSYRVPWRQEGLDSLDQSDALGLSAVTSGGEDCPDQRQAKALPHHAERTGPIGAAYLKTVPLCPRRKAEKL